MNDWELFNKHKNEIFEVLYDLQELFELVDMQKDEELYGSSHIVDHDRYAELQKKWCIGKLHD